ncbi:MAG: response regulator [Rhodospirillales bacterium]|nr:response regulator [Rhodospirillales bacterium]
MARILIAEDDDSMRRFLARALARAGYEVDAVGNGDAALELVRRHDFDLLLADVVMPGIDGVELARRAAELLPEIRVMFITGFAAVAMNRVDQTRREARILAKPFHLRQLVDEIGKALRS